MAVPPGNLPLCTHRYMMLVSYLGSKYHGSQRLTSRDGDSTENTVQEALEWSLERFLPKKRCKITASSRTDRGVHALINCFTLPLMDFAMPTDYIKQTVNYNLVKNQHDIIVNEVVLGPADFHPRTSAIGREYIYKLAVFDDPKYSHLSQKHHPDKILDLLPITDLYRTLPLTRFNLEKAHHAIELLNGEHDFGSFCIKQENVTDTVRDMNITISKIDPHPVDCTLPHPYSMYQIHFKSRSFLYNQIRRLVGAILTYASYNRVDLERIQFMLDNPSSRNWVSKMIIAEPWGLYLSRIIYGRSAFKGAYKSLNDSTEIPVDESNLPATIGISDDEPEVKEDLSAASETGPVSL